MQPIDNRMIPGRPGLPVGRSLRVLLLCAALSLFGLPPLVFAQSYTWKSVVTPAGGTITGIVYSLAAQGLIYARTDMGGAYRWDNTNMVWIPLTDWLGDWNLYGVDSIAADPKNANNVYAAIGQSYAGTTGYIIASTNQGAGWTQYSIPVTVAGNNGGNNAGERLVVDPNLTSTLYFGTRYNGLWKSTNSAATWSQVTSFPVNGDSGNGLSWVVIDPHGTSGSASATIYVGVEAVGSGNSNVYRSTDGGANWSVIPGGPTSMITVQGSLGSDGTLWMSCDNSTNYQTGQIWKLNTATLGWSNVSPSNGPGSGAGGYSGMCVDAQNAQHAVVTTIDWWGGPDKCYQTTNGGGAWNVIANTQNSWDSGPFPVYNNNGVTWTRFCGTYDGGAWYMNCMKIDPFNSNKAIYTTGGGLWSSANILASVQPAGVTWTFTDYGIEQTAALFLNAASKAGTFFSVLGDISGMRYTDITKPAPNNYCNPAFGNTFCLDFAENSPNNVARVGASNAVTSDTAFSTDNGQTWAPGTSAPPGYTTTQQLRTVAVAADGSRVIVCPNSGYGNPAYTTNRGGSWTTCNGLPSGSDLAADRASATTIYATNGGTLYRSVDTGGNFTSVNSFTGSGVPRAVFGVAGEVWVATGNGLFRFTNGGSTAATIANVSSANSVGFGKAASGQTHPAVYLTGNVGGTYGFYRCDDGTGAAWTRINDNNHQYGYGAWCGGDEAIYGRVYVGTNGRGVVYGDLVATTPIPTSTSTRTSTSTPTATLTSSSTATRTPTVTPSRTATSTATATSTPMSTSTLTRTSTSTPSVTGTATPTRTDTASATATPSTTATPTSTRTPTPTSTPTLVNTNTYTPSSTSTASASATASRTPTNTSTPTGTDSPSPTASGTRTDTPTSTPTPMPVNTNTFTPSLTATASATASRTPTNTPTPTGTDSPSPTASWTRTSTETPTSTSTATRTLTLPATATDTPSSTSTLSSTPTWSMTGTPTPTDTFAVTPTLTGTETSTPVASATASPSPTASGTSTWTYTSTSSPTFGTTATWTRTITMTATPTPTATFSRTSTSTATSTVTATWTPTASPTATSSFTPSTTSSSTFTPTGTATPTRTDTATLTPTWSITSTPTSSVTSTPSSTASWTSTVTVTSTWTTMPTSTPVGDCGRVTISVPYPNPVMVGKAVRFNLGGFCPTNVHWTVVTSAYRKVLEANLTTRGATTIVTWDLKDMKGRPVAPGLYYLVVRPKGQDLVIQALMVMP